MIPETMIPKKNANGVRILGGFEGWALRACYNSISFLTI